tara:strand:- start:1065 stop:2480 length:1416 start_codon:yes stop_codon:yes gene_type:complete
MDKLIAPFPKTEKNLILALQIAELVKIAGGQALFVGGWVRDHVRGSPSKDIDIEVYGLPARELRNLLQNLGTIDAVGESFAVYKIANLDISLPRRESKTGTGHRGFSITGDSTLSVQEATRRRDFTINAIAWNPLTNEYHDPFGGLEDLNQKVLRIVDPQTFTDDSLRVLRAMQFTARLELQVESNTKNLLKTIAVDDLPSERIWGEIEKLLLLAERPSIGFQLGLEIGIIKKLFPEMNALVNCPQEPEWHPEGDVWTHNQLVIDQARTRIDDLQKEQKLSVMLGAICHDFGKPSTTKYIDGRIRSHNHEEAGVTPTNDFLDRFKIKNLHGYDVRKQVIGLVANHLKPGMWAKAHNGVSDGAFRRLARKVDLDLLARVAKSDCLGRKGHFDCSAIDWFLERARKLEVQHQAPSPILKGRHLLTLGLHPGPQIGKILSLVYEQQLDGTVKNLSDAVEAAKRIIHNLSEEIAH